MTLHEARPLFRLDTGDAVDAQGRRLPARAGIDVSALPLLVLDAPVSDTLPESIARSVTELASGGAGSPKRVTSIAAY